MKSALRAMDKQAILQAEYYHSQRDMKRHAIREQRRQDHYRQVRTAILKLGPKYPTIHRVYLYGSLVQPGRYGPKSDLGYLEFKFYVLFNR